MSDDAQWTLSQRAAVTHVEGALLVSAAAGSGKTAVLAARCVHLVCDASTPCDVDQLLVLTFTRAAAGEMRERIENRLRERVETSHDPRLLRQLRLIERASITTLDGFCASLVRSNFHLLGIDPAFAILAPEDASLLKAEVVDRLLDIEYESPRAVLLSQLLDSYFGSQDSNLRSQLISAHALLQSIVAPEKWAQCAIKRISGGADGSDTELLTRFANIQRTAILSTIRGLETAQRFAAAREGLEKYVSQIELLLSTANQWLALSTAADFDTLASAANLYKAPTLPRITGQPPDKEKAQELLNAAKDDLKVGGKTNGGCRWSLAQLKSDLTHISPLASYFLELTSRFTQAYDLAILKRSRFASCAATVPKFCLPRKRLNYTSDSSTSWSTSIRTLTRCRTRSCVLLAATLQLNMTRQFAPISSLSAM